MSAVDRENVAGRPEDVRDGHQPGAGTDLGLDGVDRLGRRELPYPGNPDAGPRGRQRAEEAEVLGVGRDDLVVRLEAEARDGDVAAVGRRAGERDRACVGSDRCAYAVSCLRAKPTNLLPVRLAHATSLELGACALDDALHRSARQRAERPRVQVGGMGEHGQLRANGFEVHGHIITASRGAWSESSTPPWRRRSSGQGRAGRAEARPRGRGSGRFPGPVPRTREGPYGEG